MGKFSCVLACESVVSAHSYSWLVLEGRHAPLFSSRVFYSEDVDPSQGETLLSYCRDALRSFPQLQCWIQVWGVMGTCPPGLGVCLTIVIELEPVLTEPRICNLLVLKTGSTFTRPVIHNLKMLFQE
ncbi:hypothetical protein EVAR_93450_1 [Eumeta japonica]|uniref:Uncharacterized protein n=1 Tax=Eumeta variegata TaxID=151549 RepID=A0A4C1TJA6_EUMVA|nr:hypothetical protein EVAR_93450_1 [Eumeta japonica]